MAPALLDTNVLIHAVYKRSPLHAASARLVAKGLDERGSYCISPQNLVEFAAVVTRGRLVETVMPAAELLRQVETLYRSRRLTKIYPRRGTVIRAARQGAALGINGPAWYDLFLALTMRDSNISIIITENVRDFSRFPFIRARGILEEAGPTAARGLDS